MFQSRHQANIKHKVVLQYVPVSMALAQPIQNRMQYLDYTTPAPHQPCPEMVRIKVLCAILAASFTLNDSQAICCDKTGVRTACPVGSRTVGPCAHSCAVLMAGCYYAQGGAANFRSNHRAFNLLDPGLPIDDQYHLDIQQGILG